MSLDVVASFPVKALAINFVCFTLTPTLAAYVIVKFIAAIVAFGSLITAEGASFVVDDLAVGRNEFFILAVDFGVVVLPGMEWQTM